MTKNIKKYKRIGIVFICIIAISLFFISNSSKNKIVRLVNNNRDFLNECIVNKDYDKIYKIKGIKNIQTYSLSNNGLYIDFYCFGFGLVPSSTYYGFYYVSDDRPLGFQASSVKLEPDRDGWKWREANGDNCYYTEKILDHWYYYKAGF